MDEELRDTCTLAMEVIRTLLANDEDRELIKEVAKKELLAAFVIQGLAIILNQSFKRLGATEKLDQLLFEFEAKLGLGQESS